MTGKYTNNLQAAILYEGGGEICPPVHLNPFRMAMLNRQIPLAIVQEDRNFVFMRGPRDLEILVTYNPHPADVAVFQSTLGSAITSKLVPDGRDRIRRHTAHVLVEIHHGVLGGVSDDPKIAGFLSQLGMRPGASADEFNLRVDVLGEICRHLLKVQPASVVHWTQSNMLIPGEAFVSFLDQPHPNLLTVHPKLFGAPAVPGFKETPAGLLTLGAADYIGREIYVAPAPVPWTELYETALAFMRIALAPKGYVIPDDETFGPESGEFSYLVRHLKPEEHPLQMREPVYALMLRFSNKHAYTTMEHEARKLVPGGMREVAREIDPDRARQRELVSEWEQKERAAKAMGGGLELYRRGADGTEDQTSGKPARFGGFVKRAIFDRKH